MYTPEGCIGVFPYLTQSRHTETYVRYSFVDYSRTRLLKVRVSLRRSIVSHGVVRSTLPRTWSTQVQILYLLLTSEDHRSFTHTRRWDFKFQKARIPSPNRRPVQKERNNLIFKDPVKDSFYESNRFCSQPRYKFSSHLFYKCSDILT